MDRTGQVVDGKYRLDRMLGEGGMGAVYEAHHTVINRRCAVKFLHPEIASNPEIVKRFIREAQAASAIGHKGIIDIYDVGNTADGAPFLVMEFLDGVSLAAELPGGVKLPRAFAVEVVVQALSALAAAHRRGIIHRDVKPDNLYIVKPQDGPATIKLLDFGISKMSLTGNPVDRMTRTGTVLGTPYYMAPEQAAGRSDLDYRADIYAVGVILYEALTGRVPFEGENYNQLIVKILTEPCPQPRELEPEIPIDLETVIMKAMARNREDRYQDAEAMIRALVPFLEADARARLGLPMRNTAAVQRLSRTPVHPMGQTSTPVASEAAVTGASLSEPPPRVSRGKMIGVLGGVAAALVVALVVVMARSGGGGGDSPARQPTPGPGAEAGVVSASVPVAGSETDAGAEAAAPDVVAASRPDGAVASSEPDAQTGGDAGQVSALAPEAAPLLPELEAGAAGVVTISVKNLPPNATVLYDGAVVPRIPFSVKRGETAAILEVRAVGFETLKEWVIPNEDHEVELRPIRARPPQPDAGRGVPDAFVRVGPDAGARADAGAVGVTHPPDAGAAVRPPDAGGRPDGIRTGFPDAFGAPARDAGAVRDAARTEIRTTWP